MANAAAFPVKAAIAQTVTRVEFKEKNAPLIPTAVLIIASMGIAVVHRAAVW
jgi:hypothetical protein